MLDVIRNSAESWGVKLLFGLIIIVFVFWGVGSYQGSKTQVVAKVNDRPILSQDFAMALENALNEVRRTNPSVTPEELKSMGFRQQVLMSLITEELLREEAARLGISATPAEVAEQIRNIPAFQNEQGVFDKKIYRALLAGNRLTAAQFERDMQRTVLRARLQEYAALPAAMNEREAHGYFSYFGEKRSLEFLAVSAEDFPAAAAPSDEEIAAAYEQNKDTYQLPDRLRLAYLAFTPEALADKVEVTPAEIQTYYDANSSTFITEEQVRGRHILLQSPEAPDSPADQAVKAELETLIERIKAGESFAELATALSQDFTKDKGGDLGWVSRGIMVEEFEEALFSTKVGELSAPVRTPFGWHVILVEERRDAAQQPLDEVRETVRKTLAADKAADILTDQLDQALEQVISGMGMEQIATDLGLPLVRTELQSLDELRAALGLTPQAQQSLALLQAGEPTESPLPTDKGFVLAEVLERQPAMYQPLEEVRDKVIQALQEAQALERAKTRAAELAALAAQDKLPAEELAKLQTSSLFSRQGFIPELGFYPDLAVRAYQADKGQWLAEPYFIGTGYVLARVAAVEPPAENLWEQERAQWMDSLAQARRTELFNAFLDNLRNKATITLESPELLD